MRHNRPHLTGKTKLVLAGGYDPRVEENIQVHQELRRAALEEPHIGETHSLGNYMDEKGRLNSVSHIKIAVKSCFRSRFYVSME